MKKAILVALFGLATAAFAMGQAATSTVDVLGAHNNNGRGCAGCHSPHSGAFGSGHLPKGGVGDSGTYALWGQDASPLYGVTLTFGDNTPTGRHYVEVLPANLLTGTTDVGGVLLCLSCHDGDLTYSNMMQNQSYEQALGIITNTAYGSNPIPTLLGNDGTYAGDYFNDHPVGTNATISTSSLNANGLVWNGTTAFTLTAGSNYAKFVGNYGYPELAKGAYAYPYGVNSANQPYVVCTTCHNQHVMTIYASSANSPIAGNTAGYYQTYFFVNAPYNVNNQTAQLGKGTLAPSTTQFCRQCHFGEANEANNTFGITTAF